ncbi:hypothetical protein Leryth_010147 [Lithospermum erythrorhizon]|nr:hypothetical protein Leryth_010147 [Lithospermum erythrorhizon]
MSEKGRPLPKFGEWDVNDPASAEGFTVIFNKARDEKKTGGKPESPPKANATTKQGAPPVKQQSLRKAFHLLYKIETQYLHYLLFTHWLVRRLLMSYCPVEKMALLREESNYRLTAPAEVQGPVNVADSKIVCLHRALSSAGIIQLV